MLERDEETEDTKAKIRELQKKIGQHEKEYHMMSFHTEGTSEANDSGEKNTEGNKRKHGDNTGVSATDCAGLRAHSYEVEPQDFVDESGFVIVVFQGAATFLFMRRADA
jgi:hypothetical protein